MSAERDVNRIVRSWIRTDEHESADRVLQTVLSRLDTTPQRRSRWAAWRKLPMNGLAMPAGGQVRFARALGSLAAAGAAVAIVVAGALGVNFYINQQVGPASPSPSIVSPTSGPIQSSDSMWPQTTPAELQQAQQLADAGDPRYTWQVDRSLVGDALPWGAEILDRFVRERLGWADFRNGGGYAGDLGAYDELVVFRCAPGRTNPLYPDDPEVGDCAPTIDDYRYETVRLNLEQPIRRDPSGIWVVEGWEMLQPRDPASVVDHLRSDFGPWQVEQVLPPSDAEATALLETFLGARVDGAGAEPYLHEHPSDEPEGVAFVVPLVGEVPILYAATSGATYERYEFVRLEGPVWPTGHSTYRIRLFATDGTRVEQSFAVIRQEDARPGLQYYQDSQPAGSWPPTTENGLPVPIPYSFLDGEVTFAAALPWSPRGASLYIGNPGDYKRFTIQVDPFTVEAGCGPGPAPADAEGLLGNIQANPDLEATAPVAVRVGGIDAMRIDLVAASGTLLCEQEGFGPSVLNQTTAGSLALGEGRMRLYLLDLPSGSAETLAIAIAAPEAEFESVLEVATPILDSIEFHMP